MTKLLCESNSVHPSQSLDVSILESHMKQIVQP